MKRRGQYVSYFVFGPSFQLNRGSTIPKSSVKRENATKRFALARNADRTPRGTLAAVLRLLARPVGSAAILGLGACAGAASPRLAASAGPTRGTPIEGPTCGTEADGAPDDVRDGRGCRIAHAHFANDSPVKAAPAKEVAQ